ncbi:MAG: sce7726 family protein [Acidimicrobiales bacterium]
MPLKLRDPDIRAAVHALLSDRHAADPNTLIRHELGLCAGRRRVDIAVVNGELAGYEIKSDEDNLARLAGQVDAYGQVLDRAWLVTTVRHLHKAVDVVPDWWGVMVVRLEGRNLLLDEARCAQPNDAVDPFALAQLLWREEGLAVLRARGLGRGLSRKARHYVWVELANSIELVALQDIVRDQLKARREWPGGR